MIIFLYGPDAFRLKEKLSEIIEGYKKVHKSGLNLSYINAEEKDFKDVLISLKTVSMFLEKKLIVIKNIFSDQNFQESFLKDYKALESSKDVIVVCGGDADKRSKLFKTLSKDCKCQEFDLLGGIKLKNWLLKELDKSGAAMDLFAQDLLLTYAGNDLWKMQNEVKKLADFKKGSIIKKEDVELMVKPKLETDIFKTIDFLGQKNKRQAINLLHKHIEAGDNSLYLLSMIGFQIKNLLIVKDLAEKKMMYPAIIKRSGLHPFVAKKTYFQCGKFSMPELKNIYGKIFKIDLDIKTGKIEPELALDLLVSQI